MKNVRSLILALLALLLSVKGGEGTSIILEHIKDEILTAERTDKGGSISEWDSIVKENADKYDLDWRLLSSVIYHESRFHNSAESHKGAIGLMQVRPLRHEADSLAIPEYNINVGSAYLKRLRTHYVNHYGVDEEESIKFALAAYNAGERRIDSCIRFTASQGGDSSKWRVVRHYMHEMEDWNASTTTAYVSNVLKTYRKYQEEYL